jgi:GTP-binding protein Era
LSPLLPRPRANRFGASGPKEKTQIVLLDTPGFHSSEKKFNKKMMEQITEGLQDVDFILYLMDLSRVPGSEEKGLMTVLQQASCPILLVFNKSDAQENHYDDYNALLKEFEIHGDEVKISALKAQGMDSLEKALEDYAPEGEHMYPEEYLTDQPPEFRIGEIIREQVFLSMKQEIPHSVFVEVSDIEMREKNVMWIRAFLIAERESQKGMLVGKGGSQVKLIRQNAQKELGKIFTQRIHLDLRIKVVKGWRQKDQLISRMIDH